MSDRDLSLWQLVERVRREHPEHRAVREYVQMREALRKAEQLATVARDWNLNEVEIDGEMVPTLSLECEFSSHLASIPDDVEASDAS